MVFQRGFREGVCHDGDIVAHTAIILAWAVWRKPAVWKESSGYFFLNTYSRFNPQENF